jgi:hypothetical protein
MCRAILLLASMQRRHSQCAEPLQWAYSAPSNGLPAYRVALPSVGMTVQIMRAPPVAYHALCGICGKRNQRHRSQFEFPIYCPRCCILPEHSPPSPPVPIRSHVGKAAGFGAAVNRTHALRRLHDQRTAMQSEGSTDQRAALRYSAASSASLQRAVQPLRRGRRRSCGVGRLSVFPLDAKRAPTTDERANRFHHETKTSPLRKAQRVLHSKPKQPPHPAASSLHPALHRRYRTAASALGRRPSGREYRRALHCDDFATS